MVGKSNECERVSLESTLGELFKLLPKELVEQLTKEAPALLSWTDPDSGTAKEARGNVPNIERGACMTSHILLLDVDSGALREYANGLESDLKAILEHLSADFKTQDDASVTELVATLTDMQNRLKEAVGLLNRFADEVNNLNLQVGPDLDPGRYR